MFSFKHILEGYHAFLGAHTAMNKIQLYMRQIPQHTKTIIKIFTSKASPKLIGRMVSTSINNIERIGQTCVSLAAESEKEFVSVLKLLDEVIEVTKETEGKNQEILKENQIELNVTRTMQEHMQKEEADRRKKYEEMRDAVRKAQEEYSQALRDIPTGWKALALDLGRAAISLVKSFGQAYIASKTGGLMSPMNQGAGEKNPTESFGTDQVLTFTSRFADSLNELIEKLSANENKNISTQEKELKGYNVVFGAFKKMINGIPNNKIKKQSSGFIDRAIQLVNSAIKNKNATITDQLQALSEEIQPLTAAQQISSTNNAPISASTEGDSSQNEVLKAKIAQTRLNQQEQRLDTYYAHHIAAMEQMRLLAGKLARINLDIIKYEEIIDMLVKAFKLLSTLRKNWHDLVMFFTNFSAQVVTGFQEKLKSFLDTSRTNLDMETIEVDRTIVLDILNGNSVSLFHESYVLFVLSRTYYDVSRKYLMPRLSGLSLMMAAKDNNERMVLLQQLGKDTELVQNQVKQLINERKQNYKTQVRKKRAEINEQLNNAGDDENAEEVLEQGKKLIGYDEPIDEEKRK